MKYDLKFLIWTAPNKLERISVKHRPVKEDI